jgi:hypothetical protein
MTPFTMSNFACAVMSGTMTSSTTGFADELFGFHRRLEDGARLHFRDLGEGDGEPAAAMAEHRVEFLELASCGG